MRRQRGTGGTCGTPLSHDEAGLREPNLTRNRQGGAVRPYSSQQNSAPLLGRRGSVLATGTISQRWQLRKRVHPHPPLRGGLSAGRKARWGHPAPLHRAAGLHDRLRGNDGGGRRNGGVPGCEVPASAGTTGEGHGAGMAGVPGCEVPASAGTTAFRGLSPHRGRRNGVHRVTSCEGSCLRRNDGRGRSGTAGVTGCEVPASAGTTGEGAGMAGFAPHVRLHPVSPYNGERGTP